MELRARHQDLHPVIVDEFLRKVVDDALDPTSKAFCAALFTRLDLAADLMAFALGA